MEELSGSNAVIFVVSVMKKKAPGLHSDCVVLPIRDCNFYE
jgi:hypothetical protein